MKRVGRVIFVRHGESIWNTTDEARGLVTRFTGWADVPLTEKGIHQAVDAGKTLRKLNIQPDVVCTSLLARSIDSFNHMAQHLNIVKYCDISVRSWRLNERHYGGLVGLSKAQVAIEYGNELTTIWRKTWTGRPPPATTQDVKHEYTNTACHQPITMVMNKAVKESIRIIEKMQMPNTESLEDCTARILPLWDHFIVPSIKAGKTVLVVAHSNSIRGLVMNIDNCTLTPENFKELKIPQGIPLMYDFGLRFHSKQLFSWTDDNESLAKAREDKENRINNTNAPPAGYKSTSRDIAVLNDRNRLLGVTGIFLG